jgi:hypothetical protein
VELAAEFNLPVLIHTPHRDKKRGTIRSIDVVRSVGFPEERVLIDHNNEETLPIVLASRCWAGHTIYPNTKMDEGRMAALVQKHGSDRIIVNSAADWGISDPLKVPKTIAPKHSSQKLACHTAVAQIAAPRIPTEAPRISPARLPTRFMYWDADMVVIAPPITQQVTGSVASPACGASARPARPLIAISVELLVMSIAWQAASSPTLTFAVRAALLALLDMYTVPGGESNSRLK